MHELSIARSLVEGVAEAARREGARRAVVVRVRIGVLSGVEAWPLRQAFPFAAAGTVAEGADLQIEEVPARVRCRACGLEFAPDDPFFVCTRCQSMDVDILNGRELSLVSVDLDVDEPAGTEGA